MVLPVQADCESLKACLKCLVDLGTGDPHFPGGPFIDICPDHFRSFTPVIPNGHSVAGSEIDLFDLRRQGAQHVGIRTLYPGIDQAFGSRSQLEPVGLGSTTGVVLVQVGLNPAEDVIDGGRIVNLHHQLPQPGIR